MMEPRKTGDGNRIMEDADLLDKLRAAHEDGRVAIKLDLKTLDHMDSPIAVQAESNIWIYALIVAAGLIWWFAGTPAGIGAVVVGAIAYATIGRRTVERRIHRRFYEVAIKNIEPWRKLWRLQGITLECAESGDVCSSPDGNWMRFVLDHLTH